MTAKETPWRAGHGNVTEGAGPTDRRQPGQGQEGRCRLVVSAEPGGMTRADTRPSEKELLCFLNRISR